MTNTNKLVGRIHEMGFNFSTFCKACKTTRPTMRKKVNNITEFKVSDIETICVVLAIPFSEVGDYFFTNIVPKTETGGD